MDKDKLADLRRRYADAKGGSLYDPEFKRVSQTQFQGDRRKWPFAEPATFLAAPHRPNAAAESFADLDIALIGVPMDSRFSLESCHADIESHFGAIRTAGVRTLAVGGDHSISLAILKALGKDRPLGMIHVG